MAKTTITGVALRAGGLEWTGLNAGDGERLQLSGSGMDQRPAPEAWPEWSEALKHTAAPLQGGVELVLPTSDVLLRVMELPTIEEDEIQGMIELQLDEFSPFPLEQLYIGYEILSQSEQISRVVAAAAKRRAIEELGTLFQGEGLRISRIDLDLVCWWEHLKPTEASGRLVHLVCEDRSLAVIVSDQGVPVHMGTLSIMEPGVGVDWQEVAEDLEQVLLSVETEWGAHDIEGIEVWHRGGASSGLSALSANLPWKVTPRSIKDDQRLSEWALRRNIDPPKQVMDLVPKAWKQAEASRLVKKQFLTMAAVMAAVWMVLAGLIALVVQIGKAQTAQLEKRVVEIEAPAREVEAMRRKIRSISQFTNSTYSALECLRETTVLLPNEVELLSWNFRKGRGISMKGAAPNNSPAFTYNAQLAESELFGEVINDGGSISRSGRWEFKVSALLPEGEKL